MNEKVFTNAKIVLANEVVHGSLKIANGKIEDISTRNVSISSALDMDGDLLLPGLVELPH